MCGHLLGTGAELDHCRRVLGRRSSTPVVNGGRVVGGKRAKEAAQALCLAFALRYRVGVLHGV